MIQKHIENIISGYHLSINESRFLMSAIMNGEVNNSLLAALLTALKIKGVSKDELAGFVQTMRSKSIKIKAPTANTIDLCGTGGDASGTFNISTASAFVVAGAGIPVAKHGNRSVSSKCGSSDVLQALGVNVNLSPEKSEQALKEIGIAFLFAPIYHPAMKYVAPVRQELKMKTVFNILGPLTNPAGVKRQIIGTYNNSTSALMAEACASLDMEKVLFVCTDNSLDEITLTGITNIIEFNSGEENKSYEITNDTFGYPSVQLSEIKGDSAQINSEIIRSIFKSNRSAPLYVVAANSAMALYAAGFSNNILECRNAAEDSILSGKAAKILKSFIEFSNS
ncbi:MAG: anthranilate phosphoribosyltransferase [Bacteroidetes bacterium]|nr:anthranilate phosphoribosyltransferase [Bacteroidota bacterium]MBU2505179.1 anthranilate phosphoribosyltransferase [Bacteroidota bacterium]